MAGTPFSTDPVILFIPLMEFYLGAVLGGPLPPQCLQRAVAIPALLSCSGDQRMTRGARRRPRTSPQLLEATADCGSDGQLRADQWANS